MVEMELDLRVTSGDVEGLKPFAEILTPDSRNANLWVRSAQSGKRRPFELVAFYQAIDYESLSLDIPHDIRQKYETARNLLVYGWFHYRLFPIATLELYATLEFALRIALSREHKERSPSLSKLLREARDRGLIRGDGFRDRMPVIGAPPLPAGEEPDRLIDLMIKLIPYRRNELAHGHVFLAPDMTQTLRQVRDAIHQLFPRSAGA